MIRLKDKYKHINRGMIVRVECMDDNYITLSLLDERLKFADDKFPTCKETYEDLMSKFIRTF